jgi:hypothetical protein
MNATAAWRPIGHVLVDAGAISPEDLELALVEQRRSGRRLGEILIDTGRITWLQLANAIADQARDLEVGGEVEMVAEPEMVVEPDMVEPVTEEPVVVEPTPAPAPQPAVAVPEPPLSGPPVSGPPVSSPPLSAALPVEAEALRSLSADDAVSRLETVEAMLKERQRAFLELVSVTERLRATVAKLQDELDERNAEIMKLRTARSVSAA